MASNAIINGTKHLESLTYLTTRQAAELLQCSEEHIRRKVRKGEMPGAEHVLGITRIRTATLLGAGS